MSGLLTAALEHAVLGGLVALDSVLPVVPAEAVVIAASAVGGPPATAGIALAAAIGSLAGDITMNLLGRRADRGGFGRWLARRRWMRSALDQARDGKIGPEVIVTGRFVPGGRTCVAVVSGLAGVPWRRYLPAAAAGSLLWAAYITALGRLGDRLSIGAPLSVVLGVVLGLALSTAVSLVGRRRLRRRLAVAGTATSHSVESPAPVILTCVSAIVVPAGDRSRNVASWPPATPSVGAVRQRLPGTPSTHTRVTREGCGTPDSSSW